jgi:hypothetical protein
MSFENPIKQQQRLNRQSAVKEEKSAVVIAASEKYNLAHYQTAMAVDLAKISATKLMQDRDELKKRLIPTYSGFVNDYVANSHNYPNDVAVQLMVWLFDVGDIAQGLDLAFYLMPHQKMPTRFKRHDIQTFICDAIYDWANKQLENQQTALPFIDEVATRLAQWQLSEPVHSKVLVMAAKHYVNAKQFDKAVNALETAQKINPQGWGGKKLLDQAKQQLNNSN